MSTKNEVEVRGRRERKGGEGGARRKGKGGIDRNEGMRGRKRNGKGDGTKED